MSEKRCSRCGETKPFSEFNTDRQTKTGRCSQCRKCSNVAARAWSRANVERHIERARKWNCEHSAQSTKNSQQWHAKHPLANRAKRAVWYAIQTGRLVRPIHCERCRIECRPHAHHVDYSRPLVVAWLCRRCHKAIHSRVRECSAG